jgi:gp16 family phage-associated protein
MTKAQANQIKHRLREQNQTLRSWAEANGFKYRDVSDVVRGVRRGYYGEGRKICLALGIDPDAEDRLAA